MTKQGNRTQGSKTCVEYKCKTCCIAAVTLAAKNGTARQRCNAHSQPELLAQEAARQRPHAGPAGVLAAPPQAPGAEPIGPPRLHQRNIEPIMITPTAPPIHRAAAQPNPPSEPLPLRPAPHPSLPGPIPISGSTQACQRVMRHGHSLSQPLSEEWATVYQAATQRKQEAKSLKLRQQEMDDRKRRSCTLIIYHTEGKEPLRLNHCVDTFPQLVLESVPLFVDHLKLNGASRLDYWQGEWTTISLETPLVIEKDQRVLLRCRPNLLQPLEDCPGLDNELNLQPTRRPVNNKRTGTTLVSPVKKTARHEHWPSEASTSIIAPPRLHSTLFPAPAPSSPSPAPSSPSPAPARQSSKPTQPPKKVAKERKWPHDFYTYEIRDGFREFNNMLKKNNLEKTAFPKAFGGAKYVKTTVWKYKNIWNNANAALKDTYVNLNGSDTGLFSRFLIALKEDAKRRDMDSAEPSPSPPSSPKPGSRPSPSSPSSPPSSPKPGSHPSPSPPSQHLVKAEGKEAVDDISTDSDDPGEFPANNDQELCPFCDEPMEVAGSAKLLAMRKALLDKTWPDPSPRLPNHRSATSFTVYASFCEQHRFESKHLPYAILKRWPLKISFAKLYDRIMAFRPEIEEILNEPEESSFFLNSKRYYAPGSSGANDWNRFTEQGAGYYGEEGYEILILTLRDIFPETLMDLSPFSPLSWNSVIREFLLPETVVLLIQDDLKLSRGSAIRTLHQSRVFGTLMHPSDNESSAVMDVMRRTARKEIDVKQEEQEMQTSLGQDRIVIDLTLDD
ncbi:hypothetical protein FPV67DRAFT_1662416 [Lyophyllum atratum]|nr:hypothetical protein FPV67DRAFT_1662416 [Lyophyllum atratum]